jgi:hypothetical protein
MNETKSQQRTLSITWRSSLTSLNPSFSDIALFFYFDDNMYDYECCGMADTNGNNSDKLSA